MTKQEFLKQLHRKLKGLPKREVSERLNFYSEMIEDRKEEGLSEEDAVSAVGTVEEVASQISEEIKLSSIDSEATPKRNLQAWEIVLLVLGSPLWLSLLLVVFAVAITLYAVQWTLVACMWVIELPFLIFSFISKYLLIACKK